MVDNSPSPSSSTSSRAAVGKHCRRVEDDGEEQVACTGKSCQSCTAGVIADCVAVCCCPCGVLNILVLAFVKMPWAVARRYIGRRRKRRRRRMVRERRRRGDVDGIWGMGRAEEGTPEISWSCRGGAMIDGGEKLNDYFSAEFETEEVWLELFEVGHLAFGRVSSTGITYTP